MNPGAYPNYTGQPSNANGYDNSLNPPASHANLQQQGHQQVGNAGYNQPQPPQSPPPPSHQQPYGNTNYNHNYNNNPNANSNSNYNNNSNFDYNQPQQQQQQPQQYGSNIQGGQQPPSSPHYSPPLLNASHYPPPQPGTQAQQQPPALPKINPAHMPNIITVQQQDQQFYDNEPYLTCTSTDTCPPLPTTDCSLIVDEGNCSPRFMRATCNTVPFTEDLAHSLKIPLRLAIQPFADGVESAQPVACVDYTDIAAASLQKGAGGGPIRCARCRAFINVNVDWLKGGRLWECNICGCANDVPDWYYSGLDAGGLRLDRAERAELCHGSVDWVVPVNGRGREDYVLEDRNYDAAIGGLGDYSIFAVDCSRGARENGSFAESVKTILSYLKFHASSNGDGQSGRKPAHRCSLITFALSISVYDFRGESAQIVEMCDNQDPFVPIHDGLFWDPRCVESAAKVVSLLEKLLATSSDYATNNYHNPTAASSAGSKSAFACVGAVCKWSMDALKQVGGGRTILFTSTPPNCGVGTFVPRVTGSSHLDADTASSSSSSNRGSGNKKPNPFLLPTPPHFYTKLAAEACKAAVSFVIVCSPVGAYDLANVTDLVQMTGGKLFWYGPPPPPPHRTHNNMNPSQMNSSNNAQTKTAHFAKTITEYLTNIECMHDVVWRVRAGAGMSIGEYFASGQPMAGNWQCPAMDTDQVITCTLLHDGSLGESGKISFQSTFLYTHPGRGERRIRVHNLCLPTSNQVSLIFKTADQDTLIHCMVKESLYSPNHSLLTSDGLQSRIYGRCAKILAAYRKYCASSMPAGQLVLPDSFKLAPLYCMAIGKCRALTPQSNAIGQSCDDKSALLMQSMGMGLRTLAIHLYPRMYPLHLLASPTAHPEAYTPVRLSTETVEAHGVYLIDDALCVWLWVGEHVDPEILGNMFAVRQREQIGYSDNLNDSSSSSGDNSVDAITARILPTLQTELNTSVHQLLAHIQSKYPQKPPLCLLPTHLIGNMLIEDSSHLSGPGHVDYVCRMHGQIQREMSNASLMERTALLSFMQ